MPRAVALVEPFAVFEAGSPARTTLATTLRRYCGYFLLKKERLHSWANDNLQPVSGSRTKTPPVRVTSSTGYVDHNSSSYRHPLGAGCIVSTHVTFSQPRTVLPSHLAPASSSCACLLPYQFNCLTCIYMVEEKTPCWEKVPFFWNSSCDGRLHLIATEFFRRPVGFKNIFSTCYLLSSADAAAGVTAAAGVVPKLGV